MKIRIFVTGGTFDKEYNELNGKLFFKDTHIHEMLKLGRSRLDLKIEPLMMIDSLQMTDSERKKIINSCKKCSEKYIIITHGTDNMVKTAKLLKKEKLDKTIVLSGAMIPYKFGSSDGLFNLGAALAFVQTLKPDVYVAMNGKYFKANNVVKKKRLGEFKKIKN